MKGFTLKVSKHHCAFHLIDILKRKDSVMMKNKSMIISMWDLGKGRKNEKLSSTGR